MEHINYNLDANQISYLIKIPLIGLGALLQLRCLSASPQGTGRESACCVLGFIVLTELDSGLAPEAQMDGTGRMLEIKH